MLSSANLTFHSAAVGTAFAGLADATRVPLGDAADPASGGVLASGRCERQALLKSSGTDRKCSLSLLSGQPPFLQPGFGGPAGGTAHVDREPIAECFSGSSLTGMVGGLAQSLRRGMLCVIVGQLLASRGKTHSEVPENGELDPTCSP